MSPAEQIQEQEEQNCSQAADTSRCTSNDDLVIASGVVILILW